MDIYMRERDTYILIWTELYQNFFFNTKTLILSLGIKSKPSK